MRKPIVLTAVEVETAQTMRPALMARVGQTATVSFVKADGTDRTITGTVVEVTGQDDKEVVRVETAQGFRSANLYRVVSVD